MALVLVLTRCVSESVVDRSNLLKDFAYIGSASRSRVHGRGFLRDENVNKRLTVSKLDRLFGKLNVMRSSVAEASVCCEKWNIAQYSVALCRVPTICMAFHEIGYHCVPWTNYLLSKKEKKKSKRKGFTHRDVSHLGCSAVKKRKECIRNENEEAIVADVIHAFYQCGRCGASD